MEEIHEGSHGHEHLTVRFVCTPADCTAPQKAGTGTQEATTGTEDTNSAQLGPQEIVPKLDQHFQQNPLFGMESSLTQSHIGFANAAALGVPTPTTPGLYPWFNCDERLRVHPMFFHSLCDMLVARAAYHPDTEKWNTVMASQNIL